MQIHINRDGQNYGPYSLDEARQYLASGNLIGTDLAWFEGASGWMPLSQVPGIAPAARPAAAAPAAAAVASTPQSAPVRPRPAAARPAAAVPADGVSTNAGFWKRVVAYVIDGFLLVIVSWVLSLVVGALMFGALSAGGEAAAGAAVGLALLMQLVFLVLTWLYFALQEASGTQATLGKRALGIVVTDLHGARIGFGRASGRFFGKILSGLILGIGFILAGFTERKQGLHDMLASTLVVNKDPNNTRVPWWGWVIVGLFALLPVLGILAAIAIPAYSDYSSRARVMQTLNAASEAKLAITEFALQNNSLPDSLADIGVSEQLPGGSLSLQDGVLVITYTGAGFPVDGGTLGLEPYLAGNGSIVWRCGNAEPPPGAEDFTGGDATWFTSLSSDVLPSTCR